MSSNLNIQTYTNTDQFFIENSDNYNKVLLEKMLTQKFISSLNNSSSKQPYQIVDGDTTLFLPGDWDKGESHKGVDSIVRGAEREIEGVTTEDKFFILAGSSLINDLEHPGHFETIQSPTDRDRAMKEEAINIIDGSKTTITITPGSQVWNLHKEVGERSGGFGRIDLDASNYTLESQVWDHNPAGGPLRGANSSLYCIIRFLQPGVYNLKITNISRLFPTTSHKFDLEVNYKITVTG
jgi:hypothetical protein